MAFRRHLLEAVVCATLFALCALCCAVASTAPAATLARGASSHASSPAHKRFHCAKPASFHTTSGPTHSRKRHFACLKHHRSAHHAAPHHSAAGACTGVQLQPNPANLQSVRSATLCLVNRERTSRGEHALIPDAPLQHAAQGHSDDMAAGDYFEHDGRHGETPLSRMRAAGYIFSSHLGYAVGENIGWATLWLASPKAIVAGWMASPGHRANILDATFRETGIGVSPHPLASLAHGQAGAIYTQDFGRIIKP